MPRKFINLLLVTFYLLGSTQPGAMANSDEVEVALSQLNAMLNDIEIVRPYTERADLGRLNVLANAVLHSHRSIEDKGYGHRETIQAYDIMMIKFDRSQLFLEGIRTGTTDAAVTDLWNNHLKIVEARGLPAASRMVFNIFDELKHRMDELADLDIEQQLRERLIALRPEFGHVLAVANTQGDTPPTYEVATPLYRRITLLYPDFDDIAESHAGFDLTTDIMGLAEFYREFASVDD